ncbi:MAG: hypothetical protein GY851_35935, partial [bacterium]|nr:hypothetical protein [bacterium]
MCVFAQPPRIQADGTCYYACSLALDICDHTTVTMNAKERTAFKTGIEKVDDEDALLRTCLSGSAGVDHLPRPAAEDAALLTIGLKGTATAG